MSSYNTNPNVSELIGPAANRPSGIFLQKLPFGTRYWADDTKVESIVGGIASGTREWDAVAGDSLPRYWVSPPGLPPFGQFNTVTAAIAQAVLDGHNNSNRAEIYILPGLYVESVVLKDGIDLMAQVAASAAMDLNLGIGATNWINSVTIQGNVTLDAACTSVAIKGIKFVASSGNTIDLGVNTVLNSFMLRESFVQSTGGVGVPVAGAPTASPTVFFDKVKVQSTNTKTGPGGVSFTTAVNTQFSSFSVQCNVGSDTAISYSGGTHLHRGGNTFGKIVYLAASTDTYQEVDNTVSGASNITLFLACAITWIRGSVTGGTAGSTVAGNGSIDFIGVRVDSNGIGISIVGTITATEDGTIRLYDEVALGATPQTLAAGVLHEVLTAATSGGAYALTLMAIATIPIGRRVTIVSSVGGANALTVTPAGAELINGVNAPVATSAAVKGCLRLIRGKTSWLVDGAF